MTFTPPKVRLPDAYAELSCRYAYDGDQRMAQLAAWAGDVHVLEELLWENGLAQAPDPLAALAAVGESVALALEELAQDLPDGPLTARAVVEAAREALVTTFDESVHGLLVDRFGDLSQLDEAPSDQARAGAGPDREARLAARLAGRSADALVGDLRTTAADCATMAGLLAADGEPEAAGRLSRQADTAAFEAYLVAAAVRAGDDPLATVDLRWDLADRGERGDRGRLLAVLGAAERDALARLLEPEPEPEPAPEPAP
ncbi:hypothetical protein [Nocardioides sp.]|uniref:hypothetical protein n=1 Tax=Nocardioides sp. TaxID=35761 RepID=UPI002620DE95|nr:hypothetical protein [Nocardioides sp.]MDI6911849.1 hypothetical protein [Nocardioides sp.]